MNIIGLDPGTHESALVEIDSNLKVVRHVVLENSSMLVGLRGWPDRCHLVLEKIESYGMAVGIETFDTVFWTGRFAQAFPWTFGRMGRREVKMHLCGNAKAKDANIRQALIDRYGPGKDQAIGKKKTPGPLYGLAGHEFAALAVAVTAMDQAVQFPVSDPTPVREKTKGSTELF